MKLATLKTGGRDGTLVVVSRDLTRCQPVEGIARTLQSALDDWDAVRSGLEAVYEALNHGAARHARDRKSTRLNSSHAIPSRMPSSA